VSCVPPSGSTFPVGTTTVTCTASDTRGNTATATFTVTVTAGGGQPPVITVPANITKEATGPTGAVVTYTVTVTDPDSPPAQITLTCVPASGSTFPIGTTTVTCNAHDAQGNNAVPKSFTVTVRDTTPPTITNVPANKTVDATGPSGAVVTYTLPTATDLVDGNRPVTCLPASGSTFPIGQTTVTCTAKDTRNNTATKTFKVTVLGAHDQIQALRALVNSASELNTKQTKFLKFVLLASLDISDYLVTHGSANNACGWMGLFINAVQGNDAPSGPITAAHSSDWTTRANRIKAVIGC
jgi:hypothetical protein